MLFEELLLLKFIFIYFDTLKDTKPLIFTPKRHEHPRPWISGSPLNLNPTPGCDARNSLMVYAPQGATGLSK